MLGLMRSRNEDDAAPEGAEPAAGLLALAGSDTEAGPTAPAPSVRFVDDLPDAITALDDTVTAVEEDIDDMSIPVGPVTPARPPPAPDPYARIEVWRWVGPARPVSGAALRRLAPEHWHPADYRQLLEVVRGAKWIAGETRYTSHAQIFAVFLSRTGRVTPGLMQRWGQWAPAWWAWAYHRCCQALSAWVTAVDQLVPADAAEVYLGDGRWPLPGIAAEALGLHDESSRSVWALLKGLGPLAPEFVYTETAPMGVYVEFQNDWEQGEDPHGWDQLAGGPLGRPSHPQLRKGRCAECHRPWLECLCATPLAAQHHLKPAPRGVDSQGGWECRKCALSGAAASLPAAAASFCPGRVPK